MTQTAIHREWRYEYPLLSLVGNRDHDWVAATLGDGRLLLLFAHEDVEAPKELNLHKGVSLDLAPFSDEKSFLSGGDDGRLYLIDPRLDTPTLLVEHKNKWIDHVASSQDERIAYSVGKQVYLLNEEGRSEEPPLTHPSSIGGMAFSPNNRRLAIAHYNGLSLYWTNAKEKTPTHLNWKGSHLNLIWHPESQIVLTSLQENALHGWRLSDLEEMQMQGYASKVKDMAFTFKGRFLVTSGADQAIAWPFFGGGPWGKTPLLLGGQDRRLVSSVAPHIKDELVAIGYDDGMIVLAPLDGRLEIMINPPGREDKDAVVGLVWNKGGDCLIAALTSGRLLLFTLTSVRKLSHHG